MNRPLLYAVTALAALGASPALSQFQGIVSLPPLGPADSRLLLGGTVIVRPAYPGADEHRAMVLPYVDYQHRNGFFVGTGSGIGYSFIHTPSTQVGLRLIPRFGRDQDDSPALAGMGDIDPGVEASAYWTQRVTLGWTVGLNLRGSDLGAEFDAGVRHDIQLGPATRMSATAFLTAADGRSQRTVFGVDAAQSVASGYPVYAPGSGLRNAQFALTFNHFFARRWVAVGGVGLGRLLGDAADSPIVRESTHLSGFAAIGYQLF